MTETVETASRPTPRNAGGSQAIQIDIPAAARAVVPARRRYWCGLTPDAPMDHDSRGGVEFQKFDNYPEWDEKGNLLNPSQVQRGKVLELTDAQVDLIKKRVANIVLRIGTTADGRRYIIERIHLDSVPADKGYTPQAHDAPLGHFLFMLPIADSMPVGWRQEVPAPMVAAASMSDALRSAPANRPRTG